MVDFVQEPVVLLFSLCVGGVLVLAFGLRRWKMQRLVPGPRGVPVLGDLFKVASGGLDRKLLELRSKYGDIFRLRLGQMTTVFVFGRDNVNEVLKSEIFTNRPDWLYIPDKVIGKKGIIWTNGETWQTLRDMVLSAQATVTCVQKTEELILVDVDHLVSSITSLEGAPFDPNDLLSESAFNIVSAFVFGTRFDEKDREYYTSEVSSLTDSNKTQNPENMFPVLASFMSAKHARAIQKEGEVFTRLKETVTSHEISSANSVNDLTDLFLTCAKAKNITELNFLRTIVDLYIYGSEMTSSLLLWTLLYLAKYPECQVKCQEEIDKVLSEERKVNLEDKEKLPYCAATLREVLRISSPGIMTPPHTNTEDAIIGGCSIPKHSLVVCDLRLQRKMEELWGNPDEFNPERFLNINKESEQYELSTCSFGIGPRSCPAKQLVERAHFLVVVNILRDFNIQSKHGDADVSLESQYKGVSLKPKPFKIKLTKRQTGPLPE